MSQWEQACVEGITTLEKSLNLHKHLSHLVKIKGTEIGIEMTEHLAELGREILRQLERLKQNQFKIAVVGIEKAGKSSFINAWLGCDLLPSDSKRCTFTTTQIYSVINDNEQCLKVFPKTKQQFDILLTQLQTAAEGKGEEAKRAQSDLKTIKQYKEQLSQTIEEGPQIEHFNALEEIQDKLYRYVADPKYAHAIDQVQLYTSHLARADGIVFNDVPGLNSGLAKHIDESQEILHNCDAVILIQSAKRPSLESSEQKLVDFIINGDKEINIGEKLFVFFGMVDILATREALVNNLEKAYEDWKIRSHNRLPRERIIPGSAGAWLVLTDIANAETKTQIGHPEALTDRLQTVLDQTKKELLQTQCGIETVRLMIRKHLDLERYDILKKRCLRLNQKMLDLAKQIYDRLILKYPSDPEATRRAQSIDRQRKFEDWWYLNFQYAKAEANRFIMERDTTNPTPISLMQAHYNQSVHEKLNALNSRQKEARELIWEQEKRKGISDWETINTNWRRKLHTEIIHVLNEIARELSLELEKELEFRIQAIEKFLWGCVDIKTVLFDRHSYIYQKQLEYGLLRFSRPIIEALIIYPLGRGARKQQLKQLGNDVFLLDNYTENMEFPYESLRQFAKYGRHRTQSNNEVSALKVSMNQEEVIQEMESDLFALEQYLIHAVFHAAGFVQFCEQEYLSLWDSFVSNERQWGAEIRVRFQEGDPKLLQHLPEELKNQEFNFEITEGLRQLKLAIQEQL